MEAQEGPLEEFLLFGWTHGVLTVERILTFGFMF